MWALGGELWDVDGDGSRDFEVLHELGESWFVHVFSGVDGRLLWSGRIADSTGVLISRSVLQGVVNTGRSRLLAFDLV